MTYIYIVFIVLGFLLNTISILTFAKNRYLLTTSNLPILSIAIADLVLVVFVLPFSASANAHATWESSHSGCIWYAFVSAIVSFGSMLHHVVLAVEKCYRSHCPLAEGLDSKQMLKIIGFIWGFAALWSVFPLFGWSSYGPEGTGATCSIQWYSDDHIDTSYIICLFAIFFIIPIVLIIASYVAIYRDLLQMMQISKETWGREALQTMEVVLWRKKVVLTALILMASFLVVWTPYAVVSLYSAFGEPGYLSPLTATIPAIFAKTSVLLNPIVYFIRYKRFREGMKKIFKGAQVENISHSN